MHHLIFHVSLSALWRNIFHFVSCLWHCSLGVTLPPWFRSDLSLGKNVPSQPGMTTEWHIHPPPLKLHREAACWLSYDETMETNVFHFIMHISGFAMLKDRQSPGRVRSGQDFLLYTVICCIFLRKGSHDMTFKQLHTHKKKSIFIFSYYYCVSFTFHLILSVHLLSINAFSMQVLWGLQADPADIG